MVIDKRKLTLSVEIPAKLVKSEDGEEIRRQLQGQLGMLGVRVLAVKIEHVEQ